MSGHDPLAGKCKTHRHYLMDCETFDALWRRAGGCCEICGTRPERTAHGMLHIDHDSNVGRWAVRGLHARLVRASQGGGSSVYAVWFPSPRILKVGFTTHTGGSRVVCDVRGRAKERNWDTEGGCCIWRQPGDTRTEAWVQATLAFRWRAAFEEKGGRICEWFAVPELTVEEITGVVDGIYRRVPPDLVAEDPAGPVSAAC